jgi:hypothetical protein
MRPAGRELGMPGVACRGNGHRLECRRWVYVITTTLPFASRKKPVDRRGSNLCYSEQEPEQRVDDIGVNWPLLPKINIQDVSEMYVVTYSLHSMVQNKQELH